MDECKSGSSSNSWGATQAALKSLENVLKCKMCNQSFSDPVTLNTCGHTFCRLCCQGEASMGCPECKVPAWTRDLNPSHQLKNIISAVTSLRELIFETTPSSSSVHLLGACGEVQSSRLPDLLDAVKDDDKSAAVSSAVSANAADVSPHKLTRRVKKTERTLPCLIAANNPVKLKRNVKRNERGATCCTHYDVTVAVQKHKNTAEAEAPTPTNSKAMGVGAMRMRRVLRPRRVLADSRNVAPMCSGPGRQDSQSEVDVDLADVSSRAGIAARLREVSDLTSSSAPTQTTRKRKAVAVSLEDVLVKGRKMIKSSTREKRNKKGETPLHQAAVKGDRTQAELLLDLGADPNCKDHAGWTPLHDACHHGRSEVVSVLLERGALVDVPGYNNNTALHEAVANNCSQVTNLLLQHGASINLKNKYGQTARDLGNFQWIDEIFCQARAASRSLVKPALRTVHASPEMNGGMDRVVILGTGLRDHHKIILAETASRLNAEVAFRFSPEVTHVVANCGSADVCLRTYKLLCAIATGKWVLKFEWIEECLSKVQWVDETPYEVSGVRTVDGTRSLAACKRARENQLFGAPGLFDGCHFYLHGSFSPPQPSKAELTSLLQRSGGNLLTREPDLDPGNELHSHPYHANSGCACSTYILVDRESSETAKVQKWSLLNDQDSSIAVVSVGWMLDSITRFQLLPVQCS